MIHGFRRDKPVVKAASSYCITIPQVYLQSTQAQIEDDDCSDNVTLGACENVCVCGCLYVGGWVCGCVCVRERERERERERKVGEGQPLLSVCSAFFLITIRDTKKQKHWNWKWIFRSKWWSVDNISHGWNIDALEMIETVSLLHHSYDLWFAAH